jgi:hypothetical protein
MPWIPAFAGMTNEAFQSEAIVLSGNPFASSALNLHSASGCFSGRARSKASSFMQAAKIFMMAGKGLKSKLG